VSKSLQTKLLSAIESYYRFAISSTCKEEEVLDTSLAMITDFLCLPEGKLVSGKSKQKAISWQRNLISINVQQDTSGGYKPTSKNTVWTVVDMNDNTDCSLITFTLFRDEEFLENVKVRSVTACCDGACTPLASRIKQEFQASIASEESDVTVVVQGDVTETGKDMANVLIVALHTT